MIYDLDIKFLFYDGGLGGDVLARAIACRLPLSNNYDISYCDKKLNKHSCVDVFCGLFSCDKISEILTAKLNLSTNIIEKLPINEKKILLEFCFKLWLVSYKFGEYNDYVFKGQYYDKKVKPLKLYIGNELNDITISLVDHLIKCKLPNNLPKGPYLAKGHHIKYENELKSLFENYQNIYLMVSDEQEYLMKVLWHHKTGQFYWKGKFLSEKQAFNSYSLKHGQEGNPSCVFDAYKLIIAYESKYAEKLFKQFGLSLNAIINEFLERNAKINRKIIKNENTRLL